MAHQIDSVFKTEYTTEMVRSIPQVSMSVTRHENGFSVQRSGRTYVFRKLSEVQAFVAKTLKDSLDISTSRKK